MRLVLLNRALGEYGVTEIPGDKSNPEINKYFDITGHTWADDEVSWCGAYMNWVCKTEGFQYSGELTARSWMQFEEVTDPKPGDIVIFWREDPNSWKGHLGFWIRKQDSVIWTLGGNQGNMVQISDYPAYRLLKVVRPQYIVE